MSIRKSYTDNDFVEAVESDNKPDTEESIDSVKEGLVALKSVPYVSAVFNTNEGEVPWKGTVTYRKVVIK